MLVERDGASEVRLSILFSMVRARVRGQLGRDQMGYPEQLVLSCPVRDSEGTNCAYSILVEKGVWGLVAGKLAEEVCYGNFKDEVGRCQGRCGMAYEDALHDVWGVMRELQA